MLSEISIFFLGGFIGFWVGVALILWVVKAVQEDE